MSRRTVAGLLALGLIAVMVGVGASEKVPYVTFRPGPTVNVLGTYGGKDIIEVTGHRTYRDDGALRMVTVYQSNPQDRLNLLEMLSAWADPDVAVLPRDAVFKKGETDKTVRQQSALQMSSSQDNAIAAALTALGIKYTSEVEVPIIDVAIGGPADGRLKPGDLVVAAQGKPVRSADELVNVVRALKPGSSLALTVLRDGRPSPVDLTTAADPANPAQSRIRVTLGQATIKPNFPFSVRVRLSDSIGGPSAGMMFALSIYDVLTPGSLTGGKVIAGSGEITPDGVVGEIGGIGQKIVGAQRDGAHLFLVAQGNCAEAARAHYDKNKIRLVKVHTLADAIKDVEAWRENPNAALPGCS